MPTFTLNASIGTDCGAGCVVLQRENAYSLIPVPDTYGEHAWLLLCSFLVVSMQLGFAMLEVGSCRQAHRMTVLAKNVMDSAISSIAFWAYCEYRSSGLVHDSEGRMQNDLLMFHWTFCATTVTICSGSMAERTHMVAYLSYAVLMSLVIYPPVAHGAWVNEGFLSSEFNGKYDSAHVYHDFAGSGVVHVVGGTSALVGNMLLGRRIMHRVDPFFSPVKEYVEASDSNGSSPPEVQNGSLGLPNSPNTQKMPIEQRLSQLSTSTVSGSYELESEWLRRFDDEGRDEMEFKGCHYLQATGMFTLLVGWFGFNAGSCYSSVERVGSASANGFAENVALNTSLAAGAGGVGVYVYSYFSEKDLNLGKICNGVLCGLVSITGPCAIATKLASVLIGLIGGALVYPAMSFLLRKARLDDPVEAIAVHAGCGLFGVLAVAFCRPDCESLLRMGGLLSTDQARFCSDEHQIGKQFVAQAWGAFTEIWFTVSISLLLWGTYAVFECSIALEEEYLEEVYSCCMEIASSDVEDVNYASLSAALDRCPVALVVFKQHGWTNEGFTKSEHRTSGHILRVMRLSQKTSQSTIASALEIKKCQLIKGLAQFLRSSLRVHKVISLRLRIPPGAELAGLGATRLDGGRILRKTKTLMNIMNDETRFAMDASTAALEKEIRDLDDIVRGQDTLLSALAQQRHVRPEFHPGARSESSSQGGSSLSRSSGNHPVASSIGKSARDRSTKSNGRATDENGMNHVALQLLEVVQNQQRLLSEIMPQSNSSPNAEEVPQRSLSPITPVRTLRTPTRMPKTPTSNEV